jgi:hypothetical protein
MQAKRLMKKLHAPKLLNNLLFLAPLIALLSLSSCKSSRQAKADNVRIPNIKTEELLDSMAAHELQCDWLSIKYDVEIKTPKIDDSFKAYVRLKRDSAIWISATYYSVEIARFLITPDTVKYMDRRNNKYYVGDYSYLSDLFLFEANYNLVQNIILGNSNALVELDEKTKSSKDKGQYFISFLRKGQLRRAKRKEERNDEFKKDLELIVSLWIDPQTFRVSKTSIKDFNEERGIEVLYKNPEAACNSFYAKNMEITAKSENEQAEVKTSVIKLTTGKEVSLSFTIPEKYEPLVP